MGFNRSSFNRAPFNISSGVKSILGKAEGFEIVDCSIGSALDFRGNAKGYERVNAEAVGNSGWIKSATGTEIIDTLEMLGETYLLAKVAGKENISSTVRISANVLPMIIANEAITTVCHLDADIKLIINGNESIDALTMLGANIRVLLSGYEFVNESASLENIETRTCYLTVSLQPNQILIIDSNTYNVLLDSENAIDIQSGDWIDELNRNTVDLKIEAASGSANLDATILYTERYL